MSAVGLWTRALDTLTVAAANDAVAELDTQGWHSLWFAENLGREAFVNASLMLGSSTTLTIATGIANIFARDAVAMNSAARTLANRYPGRFVLGVGVSHAPLVERTRGHTYARPIAYLSDYLQQMRSAPYRAIGDEQPPIVVAALGPKALELARDLADGAHSYLVTPDHTRWAREVLGPNKLLAVEQGAVLTTDREVFRRVAYHHLELYTALANYRNSWARLGFADTDFVRGGSERLADALLCSGPEEAIARRIQEHLDAGADIVCLQVLGELPGSFAADDIRRLAQALF